MYTNISNHGGDFRLLLDQEFSVAENVSVASGYTSLCVVNAFSEKFINIANAGGVSRLLLGMAFYEGLGERKLEALTQLNETLLSFDNDSGVYITNGRRYHGKVYHFYDQNSSNIYVGSSNFSNSGVSSNVECTIPVNSVEQKTSIIAFLNDLYSPDYSVTIDKAVISDPSKREPLLKKVLNLWNNLERHNPDEINETQFPSFELSLNRIAEQPKSNLNAYFGRGRLNRTTNKIKPRPWYEIEIIATNDINSNQLYPQGEFLAYTDDGYIIPMKTQGDYCKNIRSLNSLQIFGKWLKGRLEKKRVLKKYQPITIDTLAEYGQDTLIFYKIRDGQYYLKF